MRYAIKALDRRIILIFILIVLSLFAVLWLQAPDLTDEFVIIEDFGSFYWMNQFQEPGLFPNDQLRGDTYTTVQFLGRDLPLYFPSLGYGLLFYLASFLASPILFAKLLPFLLASVTVWYLFAYGTSIRDRSVGAILAIGFLFLMLASPNSLTLVTGLQRSFALPLMIALLYHLHRRMYVAAMVVAVLGALFYPPVFLLATVTWAFSSFGRSSSAGCSSSPSDRNKVWPDADVKKSWIFLLTALVLGVVILSPVVLPRVMNAFAANEPASESGASYRYIWEDPRYREGGRSALFKDFPIRGRAGLVTKKETILLLLVLLFISALICLVLKRRAFDVPSEIWNVLKASLTLFILAWIGVYLTNSFLFYLPSRYTRIGLFLFFSMFVLLNLKASLDEGARLISQDFRNLIVMLGVIGILAGLSFFLPTGHRILDEFETQRLIAMLILLLTVVIIICIRNSSLLSTPNSRSSDLVAILFVCAAVIAGLVAWGNWSREHSGTMLDPSPDERQLLKFLQTLPKDVLLGGTPCALDSVPLLAKRQVLFNRETLSRDEELIRHALDAYYAENPQRIIDFCQAHGVDHLVIDTHVYAKWFIDAGGIFYEPYNQQVLPLIRSRDTFVLAQVPEEAKIFQSGNLFVVPCTRDALER
jgi:hypothetical protein